MCLQFMKDFRLKYINFENEVLEFLEAKTSLIRDSLREVIHVELIKLLEILIHTLDGLNSNVKENKYMDILECE